MKRLLTICFIVTGIVVMAQKPKSQVLVESKFLEVNSNWKKEIGLTFASIELVGGTHG